MNWKYIFIRWGITAFAILAATWIMPSVVVEGNGILVALGVAVVLGFINAIVRPILVFFSCGCIIATFGLFTFVINAFTLLLASWISQAVGLDFYIENFITALLASVIISVISWLLSQFLLSPEERK